MGLVTQGNAQYNYKVDGSVLGEGDAVSAQLPSEEYEFYVQDTWKVSRGLTVTAGMRWSLMPPIYEADGQQVSPEHPDRRLVRSRAAGWRSRASRSWKPAASRFMPEGPGRPRSVRVPQEELRSAPLPGLLAPGQRGLSKFLFGGPGKTSIRAGWGMYYDLFGSGLMRSLRRHGLRAVHRADQPVGAC